MKTGETKYLKQQEVLGGTFDAKIIFLKNLGKFPRDGKSENPDFFSLS